jgi:predicted Zn-dependent protease
MNQIPDEAAERVLGTIREAVDLDAQDQIAEAVRLLKRLVDEFPDTSIAHSYMAWILSRSGQHREAIEHARVAVKLSPESEMSSIMLFRVLWSAGEHTQAFDEMKRLQTYGHSEEYARMMLEWNEGGMDDATTGELQ